MGTASLMSTHKPSFAVFDAQAKIAPRALVYRTLSGDGLTPVSAFHRIATPNASFLFESVIGGEKVGRYSFVGADPFLRFEARGDTITVAPYNEASPAQNYQNQDPLSELQKLLDRHRSAQAHNLPRFAGGGAVGYAAYDSVRYSEKLPNIPADDRGLPDLRFTLHDRMVVFDHIRKVILVTATASVDEAASVNDAYHTACNRVDDLVDRLARPGAEIPPVDLEFDAPVTLKPLCNFSAEEFEDVVRRCQEYIKAGDVFQVVPSRRFEVETHADAFSIYRALRVVNPSPFLFYLGYNDFQLIGSSPEILVRVEDRTVTIRPLAGTRRRGRDEAEDRALAAELLDDPKERAEHIMLVDLGRNDVGKVSEPATVALTDLMTVERYSHVMHISSNVTGTLKEGTTALDALRAGLPAGTVSGAPKVRAMEIIDEVENRKRGPYAGAVGYIDFTGNMDTCIALRTIVKQGNKAHVQAGAGIVYDSVPAVEAEETVAKARGVLKAIEIAEKSFAAHESTDCKR